MSLTTQGILFLRPQANLLGGKQEDSPGLLKAWNPHTCVQGARISPQNKLRPEAQPWRRRLIGVRLQNKTPPWPPPSPAKKNLGIFFFFFQSSILPFPSSSPKKPGGEKPPCTAGQLKGLLEKERFPLWSRRNRGARSRVNILALGGRCWGSPSLGPSPPPGGRRWAAPPPPPSRLRLLVHPGCSVNRGFPMQISLLTPSKQRLMRPLHCSINTQSLAAEKYTRARARARAHTLIHTNSARGLPKSDEF